MGLVKGKFFTDDITRPIVPRNATDKKKVNLDHHNTGRVPNFNQTLTQKLSFIAMCMAGSAANLTHAINLLDRCIKSELLSFNKLPLADQNQIKELIRDLKIWVHDTDVLIARTKSINKYKARLDLKSKKP
jgi:hypothetical protein